MKHREVHPGLDVDGCFGCRIASVGFGAAAMPTRRADTAAIAAREKRWDRDIPAYRSMRAQGLQPQSVDGAHHTMVTATSREQVEGIPRLASEGLLTGEKP